MSAKYYGTEKVGETFEYEGKTYEVIDDRELNSMCFECAFYMDNGCCEMMCTALRRDDGKYVYYKQRDIAAPEKADAKR